MTSIGKRFGATRALVGVSLDVQPGEVRALIGENGAGKSTLMKIVSGVHQPDAGRMTLAGEPYAPRHPADALVRGVAMIYQELNLAPDLSVEANILLGQERSRWGWLQPRAGREVARAALARLSTDDIPLDAPVGRLPIAAQQRVEIARALVGQARVIVFDEPTSSLTEEDTWRLFEVIRELRRAGLAVIYISHFLEEVAEISDTYTVLRDGQSVAAGTLAGTSLGEIVRAMVGRDLTEMFPRVSHAAGASLLELRGLSGRPSPHDVNLTVHRGEIVGLAGLVGAGRSELVRTIFGLTPVERGDVRVASVSGWTPLGRSARGSIDHGVGLVSEDRKAEGLALELSIADNLTLSRLAPYRRGGLLSLRARRQATSQWMRRMGCRAAGTEQLIGQLSGGNQQKIAIARLLHQDADLLLLDEPTRGIDVGTKAEIYRLIGELAASGKGIILVSSYLPELLGVADRIGVMCRGRLVDVRPTSAWTEDTIMHAATGSRSLAAADSTT
ncbi:MAG: sugar ABC transporter ATP-binding protein [Pirellulales bacterium]|nr:sugar ABC transporter ATP-binding protein [Pirellulales bacterium]